MKRRDSTLEESCSHSWTDVGLSYWLSYWNGKKYKRCTKCGLIQEDETAKLKVSITYRS